MYSVSKSIVETKNSPHESLEDNLDTIISHISTPNQKTKDRAIYGNKNRNVNLAEISQTLNPEHVLIAIISLILDNKEHIRVENTSLRISVDQIDLLSKLNYTFEFLCQIPFSFEYDSLTKEYVFDFSHLKTKIDNVINLGACI